MGNTPVIMPDKANMARASTKSEIAKAARMDIVPFIPSNPSKANMTSTPIMPDKGNMARMPGVSSSPTTPTYKRPYYPKRDSHVSDYQRPHIEKRHYQQIFARYDQDHEAAKRGQWRQQRALAWWQAWHHLQIARREVEVRMARQMAAPDVQNSVCLQQA